jgi:curved DNA-binding protein CbpA
MEQTFAARQFIPQATVSSTSTPSRMCLNASSSHAEPESKKNAELGSIRTGGSCSNLSSRINLKQKMRKGRGSLELVRASATTTSALTADHQHRSVLGVGPDATRQDIKQAYRRLALQFHPDVCKEEHYTSSFKEVNCAYEYLINTTTTSATTPSPDYYYSSGSSSYYWKQQQGPSRDSSASIEQNYYSNCSTTTSSTSSFSELGSLYYKSTIHKSPTTTQGPGDGEDDPWADFLQSIVQGTFEESKHYSPVDYQNFPPADNIMDQQQSSSSSRVNSSSSSSSSSASSSAHRKRSSAAAASSTLDGDW